MKCSLRGFGNQNRNLDDYEALRKVGRGKYSDVYKGFNVLDRSKVALKVLKPVRKAKIKREVLILKHMSGGPNIVEFREFLMDPITRTPCIVSDF